jgi:hypothetical protein
MTTNRTMYGLSNDPAAMREAAIVAADVADDIRGLVNRLDAAGLVGSTGPGVKLRSRLELAAKRLDEIAQHERRRLAKLEPSAGARGKP